MPGTPSSHQRLEGGQGLHTGKFISETEREKGARKREGEKRGERGRVEGRGKGKQRHVRWGSEGKRQNGGRGWGRRGRQRKERMPAWEE